MRNSWGAAIKGIVEVFSNQPTRNAVVLEKLANCEKTRIRPTSETQYRAVINEAGRRSRAAMTQVSGSRQGDYQQALERLFNEGTVSGLSEVQLLERFAARNDEAAFAALVERPRADGLGRLPSVPPRSQRRR